MRSRVVSSALPFRIAMAAALASACGRQARFGGAAAFQLARTAAPGATTGAAAAAGCRRLFPITPMHPFPCGESSAHFSAFCRSDDSLFLGFPHLGRERPSAAGTTRRFGGRISSGSDGGDDDDGSSEGAGATDFEPTWTYTPYKPSPPSRGRPRRGPGGRGAGGRGPGGRGPGGRGAGGPRRRFSSSSSADDDEWKVPNKITIPEERVEVSFVRSSGAGGQNVNKLNTKVELRFKLSEASWIPGEVRDRMRNNEAGRVSKEGYFVVTSQEYRTQSQNRKDAISKLEDIILTAYPRPKVRKLRKGISKKAKERNKENKRHRSQVKASRKSVNF